jgi:proteic killer suppression protein
MIESFGNRLAEDMFYGRRSKEARALPVELLTAARRKLLYVHDAAETRDLRVPRSNGLESLKDRRKGFYSIRIIDQWNLIFRFEHGTALDVAVVGYR